MEQFPFNIVEFATIGDSFDEEDGKDKTRPVNNYAFYDFHFQKVNILPITMIVMIPTNIGLFLILVTLKILVQLVIVLRMSRQMIVLKKL